MSAIILGVIFLAVCYLAAMIWSALPYALIGVVIAVIVYKAMLNNYKNNVIKAEIIDEQPIIKRVAENTGFTVSYGRGLSTHNHYRYKNAVTGKKVKFKLYWREGKTEMLTVKDDSATYKILIEKVVANY